MNLQARMSIKTDHGPAKLTCLPVHCTNGIVFFIDSVLTIPQSVPPSLSPMHCIAEQFDLVTDMLQRLDHPGVTMFAISKPVWIEFIRDLSSRYAVEPMLRRIERASLYHVLPQVLYSESFAPGSQLSSCLLSNGKIQLRYDPSKEHEWSVNGCAIVSVNHAFDRGVIHCIEGMMVMEDEKDSESSSGRSSIISFIVEHPQPQVDRIVINHPQVDHKGERGKCPLTWMSMEGDVNAVVALLHKLSDPSQLHSVIDSVHCRTRESITSMEEEGGKIGDVE